MKKLFFLCCVYLMSSSASFAVDLSVRVVQKNFPSYIETFLSQHELVIIGKEREIMNNIVSSLDQSLIGRSETTTLKSVTEKLETLASIREKENHKNAFSQELEQIHIFLNKHPNAFSCSFEDVTETSPDKGTVQCNFSIPTIENEGCFYMGRFSILVDPKTKKGLAVYRSPLIEDKEYSPYSIYKTCPG